MRGYTIRFLGGKKKKQDAKNFLSVMFLLLPPACPYSVEGIGVFTAQTANGNGKEASVCSEEKTTGGGRGAAERHGCSFKHNSITVGGCCEEEPLEV